MVNKYEKFINKIIMAILAVLLIIFAVALFAGAVFGAYFIPMLNIMIIPLIFAMGFLVEYALGFGFFKDKFKLSKYVSNGDSYFYRVTTKKILIRQTIFWKVIGILYALYGIVMMIIYIVTGVKEVVYIVVSIISIIACPVCLFVSVIKKEDVRIKNYVSEE
ncbi:MAG: hypothetical protein IJA65_05525 [Acholeplasmatales bacterium]|nr:hypothetical protein [Acholeplasmatales bacterium]